MSRTGRQLANIMVLAKAAPYKPVILDDLEHNLVQNIHDPQIRYPANYGDLLTPPQRWHLWCVHDFKMDFNEIHGTDMHRPTSVLGNNV